MLSLTLIRTCGKVDNRGNIMTKLNVSKAKKHLSKIRELVSQSPSPFAGMSNDEAIEKMRKIREALWEEKLAARH